MRRYVHPLYALRERARGYEVAMIKEAMEMLGRKSGSGAAAIDEQPAERPGRSARANGRVPAIQ